jgi:exodeoxyribonuclease VII large subunit
MTPVILYPAAVQGDGAGSQLARAIRLAGERREVEVLIVCRGGGSLEDLWAFNEEVVARAIDACPVPVVSGVGHETDFTIADFVADVRAPTPTAAAAAASPDREALCEAVGALRRRLGRDLRRQLETRAQRLDGLSRRLLTPSQRIERQARELAALARRMSVASGRGLADGARHLASLRAALTHLDPTRVLARGYSIVRDPDGHVRLSSAGLPAGAELDVTFAEGGAAVTVRSPR